MSWLSDMFSDIADRQLLKQAYKWGEGRAKTKLQVFYAYQKKSPEMSNKELYYFTVLSGNDFTEVTAQEVIDVAAGNTGSGLEITIIKEPLTLRSVVKCMLTFEEFQRFGFEGYPHPYGIPEAFSAVDAVIPENI